MASKRMRIKATKMWGSSSCGERYVFVSATKQCGCGTCGYHPVMVLDYRYYLALRRAAKGRRRP